MTQSPAKGLTFEDYLNYDDGTQNRYELREGELIALPPESGLNCVIVNFLLLTLVPLIDFKRLRTQNTEIQVSGNPKNRWPDLTVLQEDHVQQLSQRNSILLSMAPPLLVVEVVSPGRENRERDYIDKRKQYEERGIPEYWIVDPENQTVTVFELSQDGVYEPGICYAENQAIASQTFPTLALTPNQIWQAIA